MCEIREDKENVRLCAEYRPAVFGGNGSFVANIDAEAILQLGPDILRQTENVSCTPILAVDFVRAAGVLA